LLFFGDAWQRNFSADISTNSTVGLSTPIFLPSLHTPAVLQTRTSGSLRLTHEGDWAAFVMLLSLSDNVLEVIARHSADHIVSVGGPPIVSSSR
jgi:hypothetical protein